MTGEQQDLFDGQGAAEIANELRQLRELLEKVLGNNGPIARALWVAAGGRKGAEAPGDLGAFLDEVSP